MNMKRLYLESIRLLSPHKHPSRCIMIHLDEVKNLEKDGFTLSLLGSNLSKPHLDEQDTRYLLGVSGKKCRASTTTTLVMVLTDANNKVVASEKRLPASIFECPHGTVVKESVYSQDEQSYNIITLSADSYNIDIIRASDLYIREVTPHSIHLPSSLWKLVAELEDEVTDFETGIPVCTTMTGKNSRFVRSILRRDEFDASFEAPPVNLEKYHFGIHVGPPPGGPREKACVFYALRNS
jgi:hypothetical protein